MFKEKDRDIMIVVLDGLKVSRQKCGVAAVGYALRQAVDEVVVLAFFNSEEPACSPVGGPGCCIGGGGGDHGRNNPQPCEKQKYIRILREEISQGTEAYMKIFKPFYRKCKSIGVKFVVKIVVGSELDAIVTEEANNTGATLVVIERAFADYNTPWSSVNKCNFSLKSEDEEICMYTYTPGDDINVSVPSAPKSKKKTMYHEEEKPIYCTLPNFEGIYQPSSSSSTMDSTSDSFEDKTFISTDDHNDNKIFGEGTCPVELSWEAISEMTYNFGNIIHVDSNEPFQMYRGYLNGRSSTIFVKRYIGGDFTYVVGAEKKAALTMYHKNILRLLGYHHSENAMAMVFPYAARGSLLDRFLYGSWTKELEISFGAKMNIAIGIAQGLRYMHEECPRGPIVHGNLQPHNILLGYNLLPQITGFSQAKWLQLEISKKRYGSCGHPESLTLIKSDILAFGILLLRLFCNRSAPRDDQNLVAWARPLLSQRAYHILYDELEYDFYGLFVVTSTVAQCIKTRAKSRPSMSQVISFLKGEISCADQTFPTPDRSPNMASNQWPINAPINV